MDRLRPVPMFLLSAAALFALSGCPSMVAQRANEPAAPAAAQNAPAPAKPFRIEARELGQFIDFTIHNDGAEPLTVNPQEIALLDPSSRKVVHYAQGSADAVIDFPSGNVAPPGGAITGRATYAAYPSPGGLRMVYNPNCDARAKNAVFTVIDNGLSRQKP